MTERQPHNAPANEPAPFAPNLSDSAQEHEALLAQEITVLSRTTDLDMLDFTTNWMIDV